MRDKRQRQERKIRFLYVWGYGLMDRTFKKEERVYSFIVTR